MSNLSQHTNDTECYFPLVAIIRNKTLDKPFSVNQPQQGCNLQKGKNGPVQRFEIC